MMAESDVEVSAKLQVLLPSCWPTDIAPEYGESEVKELCQKFWCPYTPSLKTEYRDFKESAGCVVGPAFAHLQCNVATLPVSTAACERCFSKMNIVCSPLRSTLTMQHMSSLLFISIVGPPLSTWQPHEYVRSWLAKGRRQANDVGCLRRKLKTGVDDKAIAQLWKLL